MTSINRIHIPDIISDPFDEYLLHCSCGLHLRVNSSPIVEYRLFDSCGFHLALTPFRRIPVIS